MPSDIASVPVLVLAGGRAKPDIEALTGQRNRALIEVEGKTLLTRVVEALQAAEGVGPLAVVGEVPESVAYRRLEDRGDFVGNVFAGPETFPDAPYLLYVTCDLPFLTGPLLTDFVRQAVAHAEQTNASILYPIVPVAACYARFPGIRRTSLKLREGEFTGGNLMLARPAHLRPIQARIAEAYAARKSPLRLALMLGFGTVLRLLLSQTLAPRLLTLPLLESQVSRLLGIPGRALICEAPEIATDLDRPSDFAALSPPADS